MSKFPFVSIESIANKVAMGPFGSSIKVETFTSEGIPIISGAHLNNVKLTDGNYNFISPAHASNLKNSIVHKKDIIFTHAGNIGQVSYIPDNSKYKNYIISQRQFYLRCNERALPEYVAYYFKSRKGKFSLLANSSQVGVPSIAQPVSYLKSIKIPLPEKKVQLAIVNILCSFDKKIELNRQMNETLEQMAQAVFQDWFVDFGPVKRKAKGITDPVAILGGLIPNPAQAQKIASLFPDQFAEDGLPEGCSMGSISTYAELNPESWSAKKHPNVIQYVDLSNTKFGIIKHIQSYSWYKAPSRAKRILIKGDTVIGTVRPDNGAYSLIHTSGLTASTGFAVLRPKEYDFRSFIYCAITRADNIAHLAFLADGGAYPAVTPEQVLDTQVSILHRSILDCFNNIANNLFDLYAHNTDQNHTLAEMRDLLLPKLMSGEISVDELEKKMGGVL